MMRRFFAPLLAVGVLASGAARAEDTLSPLHFQSQGWSGTIDKAAAQRGFAVYEGVCASCHSLHGLHYRDLEGLGLTPAQVAGIAANVRLANGQPATLNSRFKTPGAISMGGATPPDLSNIVAQRPGGTRYVYDFLTGFGPPPAGVSLLPGHFYNAVFPGGQVSMPAVLRDNAVTYADGAKASTAQEAADVAEFLTWASDPNLSARHAVGLRAVLFFAFLTIVALLVKRRIWREEG
ncbi:cytochrome c1 [Acidocella aminolytica]|jgi:ubiquinol-cytochrome c reductase cytochrome c1 subunit|nr:cytochrome c1 [Acidocella aminolytica]SHE88524.1 ubiquinol-cytochrome c reductase cytochrome c1 subunit [Acidocella aminolytica 101 = DSM 11237]